MSKNLPGFGDRLKIGLIAMFIIVPFLLLGFICILLAQSKAYIWAVLLLIIAIAGDIILAFRMVKREVALAQLKSDFVSNISHELKTPLTSINVFVEMLLLGLYKDETDAAEYLRIIQKENSRLISLVERVLDFPKLESGKMEFRYKQESIREVILSTLDIFQVQLVENECEIAANLADNLPQLRIDRDAITEALLNLLSNAVKYSFDEKKVTINAQIVNGYVAIEVIDNGMGIPKHEQKKIFQPFYRVKDTREIEGSGLGLAYVKYIIEAHGGKVTVQSAVGCGSKFTLFLPYPKERA